jgi:hypothetical protein
MEMLPVLSHVSPGTNDFPHGIASTRSAFRFWRTEADWVKTPEPPPP